jgi:glycosyltransferase involved in cell wall biosynthesis
MTNILRIAVVIPAYNEEATIAEVIGRTRHVLGRQSELQWDVFVVDDGSSDGTVEHATRENAIVISHSKNMGVGKALQTGIEHSLANAADIIVNIDADGQFDPECIPALIEPILSGRSDFVTASRFKAPDLIPEMPKIKLVGNRVMSALVSGIAGIKLYDVSCGFRAYSRDAALKLNLWGDFTYTQETILDLAVKGLRIEEIPMEIDGVRKHGKSKVASNLWHYGYKTSRIILDSYLDYWPGRFFGWISLPFWLAGLLLLLLLLIHRLFTGSFSPHIWAGFTGGALCAVGLITLIIGFLGEMLKRIRLNQEMLLYYDRRNYFEEKK